MSLLSSFRNQQGDSSQDRADEQPAVDETMTDDPILAARLQGIATGAAAWPADRVEVEPATEAASEPVGEPASEPVSAAVSEPVSAAVSEPVRDAVSAPDSQATSKMGRLRHLSAAEAFGDAEGMHAWLVANLDAAGEPTGETWTDMTRDRRASGPNWPMVAASASGLGVFEAEIGESSSETLGRLLTSLVECGATTVVWIAGDPRPEHASAVAWLNASAVPVQVYLMRVEAIRIDDSVPAPLLTTVVRPGRTTDDLIPATEPAAAASSPRADPVPSSDPASLLADTGRRSADWSRLARGLPPVSEG